MSKQKRIEFRDADEWPSTNTKALVFDRNRGPYWSSDSLDVGLCRTWQLGGHDRRRMEYERAERQRLIRGKAERVRLKRVADEWDGWWRMARKQIFVAPRPSLLARIWRWVRGRKARDV